MGQYVFHVLHNARPEYERDLLELLSAGYVNSYDEVLRKGLEFGLSIGSQVRTERLLKDILQPMRDLGFILRQRIELGESGKILVSLLRSKPSLFPEMVHFAYYTTWDKQTPEANCFSWSYRQLCQHLWYQGQVAIDSTVFASVISSAAIKRFGISRVSFSSQSVNGILNWLGAFSVPVILDIDGELVFSHRAFCPPELFIMAIDFVYRTQEIDYGANLLLNDEPREAICQVCLLDPERFGRVLEYAVAQFDYLHKGIGGGWGQYLVLDHAPSMEEFI